VKNPNHPAAGSTITVEPIRSLADIESIKRLLSQKPRDLLLFTIGVNSGLRMGDILRLKVGQVRGLSPGDSIVIREGKSDKTNVLVINRSIHEALSRYLVEGEMNDDQCLFRSRKGKNMPLSVGSANALVKSWARAVNLSGNYGANSLRKTFGYIQRMYYGVGFEVLAHRFNHSSPGATMRYLGIRDKDVKEILLHEI
jgi:integrase